MIRGVGSATGKFILIGEHFVALEANFPAIAFPLPELKCNATVMPSATHQYTSHYSEQQNSPEEREKIKSLMRRATQIAADSLRIPLSNQPLTVTTEANFPISRGFGSSAAFAVALSRALVNLKNALQDNYPLTDEAHEVNSSAYKIERLFHGNPSGLDTSTVLSDSGILFSRNPQENSFKTRKVVSRCIDFVLIDSGKREATKDIIGKVLTIKQNENLKWLSYCAQLRECTDVIDANIGLGLGAAEVASKMNEAQIILKDLGLSTGAIEETLKAGKASGALAGKLSGAGAGGATVLAAQAGAGEELARSMKSKSFNVVAILKADQR